MEQLINSLPELLRVAGDNEEVKTAAAVAAWNRIAGGALREHAVPTDLRGETLIVAVGDSVWEKQLKRMAPEFLFRLNHLVGQQLVKYVEFQINAAAVGAGNVAVQGPKSDKSAKSISFELLSSATEIRDPDLRRKFLAAASAVIERTESNS